MKVFLVWILFLSSLSLADDEDPFSMPMQPVRFVYDPQRWLAEDDLHNLELQLTDFSLETKKAIYVVILPDVPVQGGAVYADLLGKSWEAASFWGVIVCVPGETDGPWIAMGGSASAEYMSLTELRSSASKASSYARRELEETDKIEVAVSQLKNEMDFASMRYDRQNEQKSEDYALGKRRYFSGQFRWRAIAVFAGLVVIFSIVVMGFIYIRLKRLRRTFEFPATSYRRRLQGPWSGGGNVLYDYLGISQKKQETKKSRNYSLPK